MSPFRALLAAHGQTTWNRSARELGELLCLSPKTVERHRANLMHKLNLHNRSELVQYAMRKGILNLAQ